MPSEGAAAPEEASGRPGLLASIHLDERQDAVAVALAAGDFARKTDVRIWVDSATRKATDAGFAAARNDATTKPEPMLKVAQIEELKRI